MDADRPCRVCTAWQDQPWVSNHRPGKLQRPAGGAGRQRDFPFQCFTTGGFAKPGQWQSAGLFVAFADRGWWRIEHRLVESTGRLRSLVYWRRPLAEATKVEVEMRPAHADDIQLIQPA